MVQSWKEEWVAIHGGGAGLSLKPGSEVTLTLKEHHDFAQLGQDDDSLGQGVPVLLDCGVRELAGRHDQAVYTGSAVDPHEVLSNPVDPERKTQPDTPTVAACREIQDSAYLLRRDGPRVPYLFYKLRRKSSEANTQAGAQALRGDNQEIEQHNSNPVGQP